MKRDVLIKIEDTEFPADEPTMKLNIASRLQQLFRTHPDAKLPKVTVNFMAAVRPRKTKTTKTK